MKLRVKGVKGIVPKYFKSSEWHSLTGEFRQFTDPIKWPKPTGREAADAKRDSLKCVIANYWIKAISVAVLIPEWDSVRGRHPKAATYFGNDPFRAALQSVIFECGKELQGVPGENHIGFVSDDSNKAPIYLKVYLDFKKRNSGVGKLMRGLAHLDDKKVYGLQAADLVANVVNNLLATYPPGSVLPSPLPELDSTFYRIAYWNETYMNGILEANGIVI